MHRTETELRENPALPNSPPPPSPKQRGLSLSQVVQWESTPSALWKEMATTFFLYNVLSEQLQKQIEKYLEQQQHGERIPDSVACVESVAKNSWKTQLSFRCIWLESKPWRFSCWEIACHLMLRKSRQVAVWTLRSLETRTLHDEDVTLQDWC